MNFANMASFHTAAVNLLEASPDAPAPEQSPIESLDLADPLSFRFDIMPADLWDISHDGIDPASSLIPLGIEENVLLPLAPEGEPGDLGQFADADLILAMEDEPPHPSLVPEPGWLVF